MSKTFSKVVFISPWHHDDESEPLQIPWQPRDSGDFRLFTDATGDTLYINVGCLSPAEARQRIEKFVREVE